MPHTTTPAPADAAPFDPARYEPLDRERADVSAFLSYPHTNRELADQIVGRILAQAATEGIALRLWYDRSLRGGDEYTPLIAEEIGLADLALILVTEECNDATYMWTREFEAIHRLCEAPARRFRAMALTYARLTNAPRFYLDKLSQFSAAPARPFSQAPGAWMDEMAAAVIASARRILSQETAPAYAQKAALDVAEAALRALDAAAAEHAPHIAAEPVAARGLAAAQIAIGLILESRRRRFIAERLPILAAPLKDLDFFWRPKQPALANAIRELRDALDGADVAMRQETGEPPVVHTPAVAPASADAVEDVSGVREGLAEAREGLRELAEAPPPPTGIELAAREHAVETGGRHAALAEALLEAPRPDAAALAGEVEGLSGAVAAHDDLLKGLAAAGGPVSSEGVRLSARLTLSAGRAQGWSARLIARATGAPLPAAPAMLPTLTRKLEPEPAEAAEAETAPPPAAPNDGVSDEERRAIEERVCDLILDRKPVPAELAPLVRRLDFFTDVPGERLKQLTSLAPLAGLTALTSLNCRHTRVADLAPLAGLTALTSLDCVGTLVADLTPLSGLTNLASINLGGTRITDLSPLARLTALSSLDFSFTWVKDLAPLAGLTSLTSLSFFDTPVTDLSPLASLKKLSDLFIAETVQSLAPVAHVRMVRRWEEEQRIVELSAAERRAWPKRPGVLGWLRDNF